jgi:spore germination cell wall hydrolase CwlJ-like protein
MRPLVDSDDLATATIRAEAENQSHAARVAVGETIRNRMKLGHPYSDGRGTVAGVVLLRYQFSEFNDDLQDNQLLLRIFETDHDDAINVDCRAAWNESATSNTVPGAVMFYAAVGKFKTIGPSWENDFAFIAQIGDIRFYRRKP